MKRIISLALILAFALSLAACKAGSFDAAAEPTPEASEVPEVRSTEPAATPEQTAEPVFTPVPTAEPTAAPTETPKGDVLFTNLLSVPVELSIFAPWASYKGPWYSDPFGTVGAGESLWLSFDRFESYELKNGLFSVSCTAPEGQVYYVWSAKLGIGSSVTLSENENGRFYSIEKDGASEDYPALCVTDGEPTSADDRILHVKKLNFAYEEAAEKIYSGGFSLAMIRYQFIVPDDDTAASYPKLKKAAESEMAEKYAEVKSLYVSLCEELKGGGRAGGLTMEAFTRRADSRMLSVLYRFEVTCRNDVAVYWASGSYSPATGKRLELKDVVTDVAAFTETVNAKLNGAAAISESDWESDSFTRPVWVCDHDGITVFVFGGDGWSSVFIPFSEQPSLFNEELLPETEDYSVSFPFGTETFVETADGTAAITVTETVNTDSYMGYAIETVDSTDIELNGVKFSIENAVCNKEINSGFVFVRSNGHDYIIINGNDGVWDDLFIIELYSGRVYLIGDLSCSSGYFKETAAGPAKIDCYYEPQLTDPHRFEMCFVSGLFGEADYAVSVGLRGDGIPARLESVFYYSFPDELELLTDYEAELVNADGESIGSVVLHEGDKVTRYRTDNAEWADVLLKDGRIARVYLHYKPDEWRPCVADGTPATDVFFELYWE